MSKKMYVAATYVMLAGLTGCATTQSGTVRLDDLGPNKRGRVRIKMRTVVASATIVDWPPWCALWRTPYEIGNNLIVKRPLHMGKITFYA